LQPINVPFATAADASRINVESERLGLGKGWARGAPAENAFLPADFRSSSDPDAFGDLEVRARNEFASR
jgi:hypothetical protein